MMVMGVYGQRPTKFKFVPDDSTNLTGETSDAPPVSPVNFTNPYYTFGLLTGLTVGPNGPLSFNEYENSLAAECAVKSLNNNSSLNTGFDYRYLLINDAQSGNIGLEAGINLLEDGINSVVGASTSAVAQNVAALYDQFNLTLVSPSASASQLNNTQFYGSLLRTIPLDSEQAQAIAETCIALNWTIITPIYTDDAYGQSGQTQFTYQAQNNKILSTCGRVIKSGQVNGIQDTIKCLQNSFSSVTLLWMSATDASNVIASFYNSSSLPDMTFMAPDAWASISNVQQFTQGRFPIDYIDGTLAFAPALGDQSHFTDCVKNVNPSNSDLPHFNQFWEETFYCSLENESLPICPSNISQRNTTKIQCKCDGSENLANVKPSDKIAYYRDSVYSIANALDQIKNNCQQLENETGIKYCNQDTISAGDLFTAISVSSFYGDTGLVQFVNNSRHNLTFLIRQYGQNDTEKAVGTWQSANLRLKTSNRLFRNDVEGVVGTWENSNLKLNTSNLVFKDGSTIPTSQIVPQYITITDPLGAVCLGFIVLGLIISISFSIYFFVYRKEKVIKKTSPFFSQLILFGVDLCFASLIVWEIPQSTLTCIFKLWLLCIGFGLIMGNLLAKTWRIYKIFSNLSVTSLVIKDSDLLKFSGIVVLGEIILLSVYSFASGLPKVVHTQSLSDNLLLITQCKAPSGFVQLALTITLFVYNGLLILAAVYLAYKTRNVDSAFNESKYIALTVYIYLLVGIILLPLYYTAGDSPSSFRRQFVIRNLAIIVAMYFTLIALFIPKIILVQKLKKEEKKRLARTSATEPGSTSARIIAASGRETTDGLGGDQTTSVSQADRSIGGGGGGTSVSEGAEGPGLYTRATMTGDGTTGSSLGSESRGGTTLTSQKSKVAQAAAREAKKEREERKKKEAKSGFMKLNLG